MDQFAKETIPISLEEEMRKSYLDYAMSVIVGRALPDVRDGLKPVHRRVLYGMHELNNVWNRPYVKCARVVGEVMGKYHPHGDASIYDTLVRMAQDFSLRYTLVDGQGNFGSVDGDNAAAMRYTECRLDKISSELLADIDKDTVDYAPNYDGKEKEPTVLPTRLPNLLINGSSGIAVGMATNIPPHNLSEVIKGALHVLANPDCSIDELIELIPAPDFPTAGIIYGVSGVRDGYRTGRGRVVMRARTHFEEFGKEGGRTAIIVDELPYQVNKKSLLERIAENVRDKKLEGISDIRDESDKSGMRVVIELKRGEVPEVVLNNLYKQTQLQDTFGMNMVALVDGQPKLLNLKEMLQCFLSHRREVVTRRTVFELRKARERGHMLEGLAVALANIDDFIAIIKAAPTPPIAKAELMQRAWDSSLVREMLARTGEEGQAGIEAFRPEHLPKHYGMQADGLYKLSDEQAQEILQMRLQRLTGLEQDKIVNEYKDVMAQIADLLDILAKPARVTAIIVDELNASMLEYGEKDARRSTIEHNATDLETEDLITPQDMVVTLSHMGYMKAQPISEYRAQKRGGRGKQAMATKDEDWIDQLFIANTHDYILCFSNRGRLYWLKVWEVPQGSRTSRGKPIVNMFPLQDNEKITVVLPLSGENRTFPEDHYVFMATSLGTVKKTPLKDFSNPRKAGIIAVDLDEGDFLIGAALTDGAHDVMLFSDSGKAVRFDENDVRPMGRQARGVRGMNLEEGQNVIALLVAENEQQSVLTATENGFGKRTPITEYTRHGRGTKGMIAIQTSERNGKVVAATLVDSSDEIMLITTGGVLIRTRVAEIREMGRATQGVTLIAVEDGTKLSGLQRIVEADADEVEEGGEADGGAAPEAPAE
ncbi:MULTISPECIES: DNA gyrase subunit A [unclassified Massilia]|uniref:DNA gyrase subunit A n=1 Tax=unclassified Massilia TaxID=2609279 RepID=UPI00067DF816|nr:MULTISPECIES: DNA gyrase subunit A [unclassified Massilia]AKU22095.1 DNA gyrase subunit A [Massilia sp. NR 4-1]UMR33165.1 DNA gyrase subunit A [Massilia sp. MB5]UTY55902.1 DNA gyrase subunit A [Massilia sp. erpn]